MPRALSERRRRGGESVRIYGGLRCRRTVRKSTRALLGRRHGLSRPVAAGRGRGQRRGHRTSWRERPTRRRGDPRAEAGRDQHGARSADHAPKGNSSSVLRTSAPDGRAKYDEARRRSPSGTRSRRPLLKDDRAARPSAQRIAAGDGRGVWRSSASSESQDGEQSPVQNPGADDWHGRPKRRKPTIYAPARDAAAPAAATPERGIRPARLRRLGVDARPSHLTRRCRRQPRAADLPRRQERRVAVVPDFHVVRARPEVGRRSHAGAT